MAQIAIVGDDSAFGDSAARHLVEHGWDVILCDDDKDALARIQTEKPEVVLLRIHPDGSEREWSLLRRLQDGVQTYDLPVVVSAPNRDEFHSLHSFMQRRGIEVWYPPFEIGILAELIQTAQLKAARRRRDGHRKSTEQFRRGAGA